MTPMQTRRLILSVIVGNRWRVRKRPDESHHPAHDGPSKQQVQGQDCDAVVMASHPRNDRRKKVERDGEGE